MLVGGILYIFLIGYIVAFFFYQDIKQSIREDIRYTVALLQVSIDSEIIENLRATDSANTDPVYQKLRNQFLELQESLEEKHLRWIYIMKQDSEGVKFLLDSVSVEDIGHSEPGVLYELPPKAVYDAFEKGEHVFTGPFTDEYGTYYSAFTPIKSTDGKVIGVIGADMEEGVYRSLVVNHLLLPIISTIFVAILYALFFFYLVHLNQIEKLRSEFISIATHQLKTPITGLRWISEELSNDKAIRASKTAKEHTKSLKEIVDHLHDLVRSLLSISRLDTGKIVIHKEQIDLEGLVTEELQELKPFFDLKKQKVSFMTKGAQLHTISDQLILKEVLNNLLTNANKYTPEKGTIAISLEEKSEMIELRVADSGYGIPLNEQKRLFEKFYRGSNIVELEEDGNGLGLYFVKNVLNLLKIPISFSSEEGKGTEFTLFIKKHSS